MDFLPIKRALISLTDKSGILDFANFLVSNDVEIISTGGTLQHLAQAGIPVASVESITGFPEILEGRVKTLHPKIHAGILADKDKQEHVNTLRDKSIAPFDLVCVNLYDFAKVVEMRETKENPCIDIKYAIEQIDIGGPCLLRAAAKNFNSVLAIPNPKFYSAVISDLKANNMSASLDLRIKMAHEVFELTSKYDKMIAKYLADEIEG